MTADNPIDIKINAKASANFDSFIKAIPKGLGRLFSLVFAKREAKNARFAALMAAKTQIEYRKMIESGYDFENDCLVSPQDSMSSVNLNPLQIEERQEVDNLAENIRMAAETLKDIPDNNISDKEVDDDFFARWRQTAKVIGNEELQRLWGRLLAEEIKCPNSVPFRTLDVLKNISSSEAILFQKIAPYISGIGVFVCSPKRLPYGITFDDLIVLKDAGLIASFDVNIHWQSLKKVSIQGKDRVATTFNNFLFSSAGEESIFSMPGFGLSSPGVIASNICNTKPLDLEQIIYLCKSITKYRDGNIKRINVYKRQKDGCYSLEPFYKHL